MLPVLADQGMACGGVRRGGDRRRYLPAATEREPGARQPLVLLSEELRIVRTDRRGRRQQRMLPVGWLSDAGRPPVRCRPAGRTRRERSRATGARRDRGLRDALLQLRCKLRSIRSCEQRCQLSLSDPVRCRGGCWSRGDARNRKRGGGSAICARCAMRARTSQAMIRLRGAVSALRQAHRLDQVEHARCAEIGDAVLGRTSSRVSRRFSASSVKPSCISEKPVPRRLRWLP